MNALVGLSGTFEHLLMGTTRRCHHNERVVALMCNDWLVATIKQVLEVDARKVSHVH
jgi:hypothetical protein